MRDFLTELGIEENNSGVIIGDPGESRMEVKVDVRLVPPLAQAA